MAKVQNKEARVIVVDGIAIKPAFPIDIDIDSLAKKHPSIAKKIENGTLVVLNNKQANAETKKLEKAIEKKLKAVKNDE